MIDLLSLTPKELKFKLIKAEFEGYRAGQIYNWLYKGILDFKKMSNLPDGLITHLNKEYEIKICKIKKKLTSRIDDTIKYLMQYCDGEMVECVLMRYKHGNTLCLSTQVGCRMGCDFCASAKTGFRRNLTPSEILAQIMTVMECEQEKISNIVLMGIGEPLDNYDNVIKFIRLVNLEEGLNIGMRHISLSTCGLIDKIKLLQKEELPITLSVSLHAPNNQKRCGIMPVSNKYTYDELIDTCRKYAKATGRRISFEYALIDGYNDSIEDAEQLGKSLKGMLCHLNLIRINPIKEKNFKFSEKNSIEVFTKTLERFKISVTVRRRLGADIDAACGQLRANTL